MYKLFHTCKPEQEFLNLNFQLNQNPRIQTVNFFARQNYEAGKNILLNRLSNLNNKINITWLDLSLNTFKIKCNHNLNLNITGYQTSPYDYCQAVPFLLPRHSRYT